MADTDERTHTESSASGPRRASGIGIAEVRRWTRKYWLLVAALALSAGAVAWLHSLVLRTDVYRASAIIAIVPPKFASDLLPSTFTIQGYRELLESDAVIAETERRLIEAGEIGPNAHLGRNQLKSTIFVSQRSETSLAPMIRLATTASSANLSAAIVNTWAQVFLDRVEDIVFGTTSATIQVIETLYPQVRERLEGIEDRRLTAASEFDRRQADIEISGHRSLAEARGASAQIIAEHEAETVRLLGQLRAEKELGSRHERLSFLRAALRSLEEENGEVDARLVAKQRKLEQLQRRLEETPSTVRLSRSLPPEALLETAVSERNRPGLLEELTGMDLVYEVQNPVYNQLVMQASEAEIDVSVLRPRSDQLVKQIGEISDEISRIETTLAKDEGELNRVTKSRSAELQRLIEERSALEEALEIDRNTDLVLVERQRDHQLTQLDRQLQQQSELYEELSSEYNEVLLAKEQGGILNVRLAAPGVPPQTPVARSLSGKTVVAMFLGALLGLSIAVIRESAPERGAE